MTERVEHAQPGGRLPLQPKSENPRSRSRPWSPESPKSEKTDPPLGRSEAKKSENPRSRSRPWLWEEREAKIRESSTDPPRAAGRDREFGFFGSSELQDLGFSFFSGLDFRIFGLRAGIGSLDLWILADISQNPKSKIQNPESQNRGI